MQMILFVPLIQSQQCCTTCTLSHVITVLVSVVKYYRPTHFFQVVSKRVKSCMQTYYHV